MDPPPVLDLPGHDPPTPRFLWLAGLLTALTAAIVFVRPPVAGAPPGAAPTALPTGAVLAGADLFVREGCGRCHVTAGTPSALGPSLAGARRRAQERLRAPGYAGDAATVDDYLREATLDHCVDILPGYACPTVSEVGLRLGMADVDRLIDYLLALPAAEGG